MFRAYNLNSTVQYSMTLTDALKVKLYNPCQQIQTKNPSQQMPNINQLWGWKQNATVPLDYLNFMHTISKITL